MATKVLDLLLQLSVKGTAEAQQLQKAVEALKGTVTTFKGRTLDDILNGTKAKADLDLIVDKTKTLFDLVTKGGKTPVDLNLGAVAKQLDLVLVKGRQFFDLVATSGRTRVDLNLGAVSTQLDLVIAKGRQLFDLVARQGRTRVDFDLGKIEAEAQRAQAALLRLQNQTKRTAQEHVEAARLAKEHGQSIAGLTREFLLFRRALFGLGIITAAREVLILVQAFDKARQSLTAVFGETRAAEEFAFITQEAERLGIKVTDLAQQYAKFSAAGLALGLSQELVRDNFLAVAEAGAKLALSSDEIAGALTAIQQIASKGKLSLEELRQQLGDRIPGAISIAAKGLQITEARLFALVEAGQITSDMFLKTFPAALRASFGTDANTRIDTTTANLQRFKNALSELTDAALRAGALEAFTQIVKELTALARDPSTIQWFKELSASIANVIKFARENAEVIKTLVQGYATLRIVGSLVGGVTALASSFRLLQAASAGTGPQLAQTATGISSLAVSAAQAVPALTGFFGLLANIARVAASPINIVLAVEAVAVKALLDAVIAKYDAANEKALALGDAMRAMSSEAKIANFLTDQAKALEKYADTLAFTEKEINSLSVENLKYYKDAAEGAQKLADLQARSAQAQLNRLEAERKVIELNNDKSTQALIFLATYQDELARLTKLLEEARAKSAAFGGSLTAIGDRAKAENIAFDPYIQKLQDLGKSFEKAEKSGEVLSKISFEALDKDAQGIVTSFRRLVESGESAAKAIEKVIPKNFAEGGVKSIKSVADALALLEQQGELTANQIGDNLAKALDKLNANELQKFAIQAEAAFGAAREKANQLRIMLDAQLRASLKNLGLDADTAGTRVSKAFNEILGNFNNIAQNARTTGAQLRGALDIAIASAKTREELLLLRSEVERLGVAGGKMGKDIEDSLTRLDDKIRLSAGIFDSALGDSFNRFGIKSKEQLAALATQAQIDFKRIADSGKANALQVEEAWRKMADEVTKANNGIPPIQLTIRAVDFNAFDIIVKAAEEASVKVRKAIENAIPLAETKKQLTALADSIRAAFDKGKISADEFGKLITEIGFKIREVAAKPIGEVAAAAEFLGIKTRDQLRAAADNAKEAFDIMRTSGQFTQQELAKAAQAYYEAYKAANDGVVDSFDPVLEKAMEVLGSVNNMTEGLGNLGQKVTTLSGIGASDLRSMGLEELQRNLTDTIKAYRAIGIQNVEDLQIVQAIQKEINLKGQENSKILAENAQKLQEAAQKALGNTGDALNNKPQPGATGGGGGVVAGGQTFNFNFSGGNINADTVRREVAPILATTALRRR